jgi:hypothetical protein
MIPSAYLRVFLDRSGVGHYAEYANAVGAGLHGDDHFLWSEPLANDAFVAHWRGGVYVCPRYPRLRMLEGVLAFNNAFPDTALIPRRELVEASEELAQLRSQAPVVRSYILTSPWHVPIRWFAAFLHGEREIYEHDGAMSIRYRALLGEAVSRVRRAIQTLGTAGFDATVVGQMEGLLSWLEDFPGDSMVELDYATAASLFSEGDLVLDESAADTAASLLALEHGNYEEAGSFYARVASRWARVQSLAFAN